MDYISVEEAITAPGLRLVLTAGVPGPWGEAAKSIFHVKGLPFTAVSQHGGAENTQLQTWTGQNSAPVAVYNDEPARTHSLDILYLAERLNPTPSLIPDDLELRIEMFGLIQLIIGEQGFAWQRRLGMLHPVMGVAGMEEIARRMGQKYGYSEQAYEDSPRACAAIVKRLVSQLRSQQHKGSGYFIGEQLTALDLYWASFANMLRPLPADVNPMPEHIRQSYETVPDQVSAVCDELLFQHRDFIFAEHLALPLDF